MAINDINPGYTGWLDIGTGKPVRFNDASINAKQDVNAPDMIMGHWDHNAYVFGKVDISGSVAGPVTESFAGDAGGVWNWGTKRSDSCGLLSTRAVSLHYYCDRQGLEGKSRLFPDMLVNTLTFSCAAGDIAQFSIDVMGATPPTWGGWTQSTGYNVEEKLLTWDQVGVTVDSGDQTIGLLNESAFSNFEFSISNNLEPVYAIHNNADYYPFDIVPGMRTLTGSLSVYNIPEVDGKNGYGGWDASARGSITFTLGEDNEYTFRVRFHRVEATSSVGPIISTVAFTGVGVQPID